jgi:hypothetical protein
MLRRAMGSNQASGHTSWLDLMFRWGLSLSSKIEWECRLYLVLFQHHWLCSTVRESCCLGSLPSQSWTWFHNQAGLLAGLLAWERPLAVLCSQGRLLAGNSSWAELLTMLLAIWGHWLCFTGKLRCWLVSLIRQGRQLKYSATTKVHLWSLWTLPLSCS